MRTIDGVVSVFRWETCLSTPILIAASVIIPLVWGWGTHVVFQWLWPPSPPRQVTSGDDQQPPRPPFDYQI
ncbi:hypothetical protein C5Y97_29455 [Blastopirellula marina]|uniref:Uncharacterized protein n=1 Tax=Blastopirellula marina TaxID=124 RepID=A0A2S8F407_9BACT|nr:hypothetical protein C5Y98_29440 [Blastopirellula marina]PTL41102.1 hypothetical protein C5Y97_29455 [Blastopirellula marina]